MGYKIYSKLKKMCIPKYFTTRNGTEKPTKQRNKPKETSNQIRVHMNENDDFNIIGGRDVTKPDYWENQIAGRITSIVGIVGFLGMIFVIARLAMPIVETAKEAFPV